MEIADGEATSRLTTLTTITSVIKGVTSDNREGSTTIITEEATSDRTRVVQTSACQIMTLMEDLILM